MSDKHQPTAGGCLKKLRHKLAEAVPLCRQRTLQEPLDKLAKAVLERRNYHTDLPLLKELTDSFNYNHEKVEKKIRNYKAGGFFLLFAIPIVSTVSAFLINVPEETETPWLLNSLRASLPLLSLILALLTVLNSIVKPAVRFSRCCRIGLDFFHWRSAFLEGLEKLEPLDDKKLVDYLADERKKFRKIQEAQIELALPDQT